MPSERNGMNENRHSFEEAKKKRATQAEIDKLKHKVEAKKEKKHEKDLLRKHK